jgi:ABC-type oligopeptide transport system substrate-binding subunit
LNVVCPDDEGMVGVCVLKASKLILAVLLALLALAGCNSDEQSSSGSTTNNVPTGNGVATLSWEAPTTTTTGETLTNLAGYKIYYGVDENDLTESVSLNSVGVETYVIENLGAGTWYFAIKAVTSAGAESSLSNIVSKTIS